MSAKPPEIPGIDIIELQRENSIAQVWKAEQRSLSRIVSVERLHASFVSNARRLTRYLQVARAIARQKHPNLVQIYDVHADGACPHLLLEYVPGPSLADLLANQGRLPPSKVAGLGRSIASVMDLLWEQERMVHGNLKPSEIRMDAAGVPRLVSFGSAQIVGSQPREDDLDGWIVGTPNYLSPEQCRGERDLDYRADIYTLGATLYHALTGCLPFAGAEPETTLLRQIQDTLPHPRQFNPASPNALSSVLIRMMMKAPQDRHSSWSHLAQDLARVAVGRTPRHAPQAAPSGTSTIAPPPQKVAVSRPAASRPAERPRAETPPSPAFQFILWVALAAGLFGWARVRWEQIETAGQMAVSHSSNATAPPSGPPPENGMPSATVPASGPPPTAGTPSATPTGTPSAPPVDTQLSEAILNELSDALRTADRVAIRRIVQRRLGDPGVGALRGLAEEIPDPDVLSEQGILAHRGQTIELVHRGQPRTIVPLNAINGEITAELRDADSIRQVPFRVSQLSIAERLRWMPPPRNPPEAVARAILLLQDGRDEEAAALASRCGAFEPVIRHATRN